MEEILMLLLNCEDWPLMVLKDSLAHMGAQQKMIVNWAPFWDPDYVPHGRICYSMCAEDREGYNMLVMKYEGRAG
ncbi:uncharacterized [Tachysurus ichikawai]